MIKRSLKNKIRDLLKRKDQNKRTLKNSLPIFKFLSLVRRKSQELIKKAPYSHVDLLLANKYLSLGNGLRNKRSSMKNTENKCKKKWKSNVNRWKKGEKKRRRLVLKVKMRRKSLRRENKGIKRIMLQDKSLASKLREKEWKDKDKDRKKESKEVKREILIQSKRLDIMAKNLTKKVERKKKM